MAGMWMRTLNKQELTEAIKDYLVKHRQIDEADSVVSSTLGQVTVQIQEPEGGEIPASGYRSSVPAEAAPSFDKPEDVAPILVDTTSAKE